MRKGVLLGEQGVWPTGRASIQTRASLGKSAHSHSPEAGVSKEDLQNQNGGTENTGQGSSEAQVFYSTQATVKSSLLSVG